MAAAMTVLSTEGSSSPSSGGSTSMRSCVGSAAAPGEKKGGEIQDPHGKLLQEYGSDKEKLRRSGRGRCLPMAAEQPVRQFPRANTRAGFPPLHRYVEAGVAAEAVASTDRRFGLQAFASFDRPAGDDGAECLDAPACLQVFLAMNCRAGHYAMGGADRTGAGDEAAGSQALAAMDGTLGNHVLADVGIAAYRQQAAAGQIPLGTQVATTLQRAFGLDAPASLDVSAGVERSARTDVAVSPDILACDDGLASANPAACPDRSTRTQDRIDLDVAAHLQGASEHDCLRIDRIYG